MQNIEPLLRNAGVLPSAFYLLSANAVSSDGTVIACDGTTAQGVLQGWVAHLPLPTTSSNLSVTPNAQLKFYGPVGGPFYSDAYGASAAIFTLKNTGTASLDYADSAPSWLSVSSSSGMLAVGASASSAVMPRVPAVAAAAGNLASTVAISNTTNGAGNTRVAAILRIFSGVGNTAELGPNDTSVPVLGAALPQFPYPSP